MIMAIKYTVTRGFSAIAGLFVVCCCWRERSISRLIAGVRVDWQDSQTYRHSQTMACTTAEIDTV